MHIAVDRDPRSATELDANEVPPSLRFHIVKDVRNPPRLKAQLARMKLRTATETTTMPMPSTWMRRSRSPNKR